MTRINGRRPTVASMRGVVAAAHPLAAQAGIRLLQEGGNAFDAAAAVAGALNVVEPYMSGMTGMGTATCYVAAEKRVRVLDFVPLLPRRLPVDRLARREQVELHPLGCGTPGNLAGWCELVRAHGRKTLADIFRPAVELARGGFPLADFNARAVNDQAAIFAARKCLTPEWQRIFLGKSEGRVSVGTVLRQPELARSFEAVIAEGPKALYGGSLGRTLVEYVEGAGGCLTLADLEEVEPVWREPLAGVYRGLDIHTPPPPAQGFQQLLTLAILDGFNIGELEEGGPEHLDLVFRAIRLAAATRIEHENRPAGELAGLLSGSALDQLRKRVDDGNPISGQAEQMKGAENTTSFSVGDGDGNLVCITQSIGATFGCGHVVPGLGLCLNNLLYWLDLNRLKARPGVDGRTFPLPIAPTIATRQGAPVLAIGTPGSYGICQTQSQALVRHLDFGLPLQDAIEAPRGRLYDGRHLQIEARVPEATRDALQRRGHEIEVVPDWTWLVGGMQAVSRDPATAVLTGAADPRRDGYVAAF